MRRYLPVAASVLLLALVFTGLGLSFQPGVARVPDTGSVVAPGAIPEPTYTTTTVYGSKSDTLTVLATVRPSNMPADATVRWYLEEGRVPLLLVSQGQQIWVFPWKGAPQPGPGPGPNPPVPPVPVTKLYGVTIIYESKNVTVPIRLARDAAEKWCRANKVLWRWEDKDVVDETGKPPADLTTYLDRAKGKSLPWAILIDAKGGVIRDCLLPATPPEVEALLKQYMGGIR
jgi:hypothetical protein